MREIFSHPAIGLLIALAISFIFASLSIAGIKNMILAYFLLFLGWLVSMAICYVGRPALSLTKRGIATYATIVSVAFGTIAGLEYWVHPKEVPNGPRLEMAGIKTEVEASYYKPQISFHNTSETAATSYLILGTVFVTDSNDHEVEEGIKLIEEQARHLVLRTNEQIQITRGMGVSLKTSPILAQDVDLVKAGRKKMYVVALAAYSNSAEPIESFWVTELCAQVTKPFDEFESCAAHNRYFRSDRNLNKLN
jgi:hypothetical protein